MEKQETIADILAAMRDEGHTGESSCLEWVGAKMRYYADRLEAAQKREKSAIEADALAVGGMVEASRKRELSKNASKNVADFGQLGDCAKMREAMKTVKRYFDGYTVNILELRRKVDAALAKPPRNCDVGTAEEQFERWYAFCDRYDKDCTGCPCKSPYTTAYCFARWAQMPYEEGGVS